MTLETKLIQKAYYEMFINEHEETQPIRVLGEAFHEEIQKDIPDLSHIRFAQGEVYFHNKDFEAAIFKWENIINELEPWAKKNTADAYYELGQLSTAEDIYSAIEIDDLTLNTEVALQLFSLYLERGKIDSAVTVIKKTILSNPDYPNVTQIARSFFEEKHDFENAIELAVNEAIRTESLPWFKVVNNYVGRGLTKALPPTYFSQVLTVLYRLDQQQFEQLTVSLWNSYKNEESFFYWLKEINLVLFNLEISRNDSWHNLSLLFNETYFDLIDGKYFIKRIQDLVPDLLTNWLRLTDTEQVVLSAAAVLSWSELFPASISTAIVSEAENTISQVENDLNEREECLQLFDSILTWAKAHDMGENNRLKWIVQQLTDFKTHHVVISGLSGSGKSTFINTILGEELQDSPTTSMIMFKDSLELDITEITDQEVTMLSGLSEFQEKLDRRRNALESIIEFKRPVPFLHDNNLVLLDTPGINGNQFEVLQQMHAADTVLFALDANDPFSDKERSILSQIHDQAPDISVHFLLNKMDTIPNEQEAQRVFDETRAEISLYLPDSRVFPFSAKYESNQQLRDLKGFIESIQNTRNLEDKRLAKLLFFIRSTITHLLQKRIDVENQLIESIRWNEEMTVKLTGALNQLNDAESQKTTAITRSYRSIKEVIQKDISEAVPKMLRECSTLIREDSNFSTIHMKLNEEMNKRIQDYLSQTTMPKYYKLLQEWIGQAKQEFDDTQRFLDEMGEGLNIMFGEERIRLECDFKVLNDWQRDTDRMTSSFHLEEVNILLRRTASQFLLKSAGKLLGAISQNKALVYNKYKAFVENENYLETIELVTRQFFQQFELFEKSLERDISLFFRSPSSVLNHAIEEAQTEVQTNQELLKKMNTNPEMFRDPLRLFEVRLRQFEWMTVAGKGVQTIY
jgi:GTP-binding protein EngB required for normal cell division